MVGYGDEVSLPNPDVCRLCRGRSGSDGLDRSPLRADGPLLDLLIAARSVMFPAEAVPDQSPVAVIAVDARSLAAPELAPYPRTFLAPVWATVLEGVFQAEARAVGFDLLFAYSANQFSPNFDAPFLAELGRYRDQVVLARTATTLPARPFLAALRTDASTLGLVELVPDLDERYRRIHDRHATQHDGALPSLVSALLARAKAPPMPSGSCSKSGRHEFLPATQIRSG